MSNVNDYIINGFDRLNDRLEGIDTKVGNLKDITIDSKNRIDHIEATYAQKMSWKNISFITVSFCAILSLMLGVATLFGKPNENKVVSPVHQPFHIDQIH